MVMDAPFFAFSKPTSATFVIDRRIYRKVILGWYLNEEEHDVTYLDVEGVVWDSEYLTEIDGYSIDKDVWA